MKPEDARKIFGQRIKDARHKLGIPQIAVCSVMGVKSEAYLSRIEAGIQDMPVKHFEKIADTLKIDVNELCELRINLEKAKMKSPKNMAVSTTQLKVR